MRSTALAAALCLLLATLSPVAQTSFGTVTGVVRDEAGKGLPGATVTLTITGSAPLTQITNGQGTFTFQRVRPGDYGVSITLAGFRAYRSQIVVKASDTARLTVVLGVSAASESVVIAGQAGPLATPVAPESAKRITRADGLTAMSPPPMANPWPRPHWPPYVRDHNTEAYDAIEENRFRLVASEALSTFSIDVDTASYANVRRFLNGGSLPPRDAVRIEEMINYFRFEYPRPNGNAPFSVTTELAACPWNSAHRLALIGLQAAPLDADDLPARNLVFLLDVSGSMASADKLPLVRTAMRMLVDTLTDRDRIAIVVYAGASGVVLPSTPGSRKERIHQAIAGLEAGGSTNGGAGITLAYQVAQEQFVKGGINRVILATDGDFNVGVTNQADLVRLIEEKRAGGIFLSVLGVGTGNIKDSTMEKLADKGNGNYSYLDSLHEARKVLVREAGATLATVAKDVKIQVEFNPAHVAAYRLIGYENRVLRNEDFNDDRKDAGEIGAGHTVTALYEIVPAGGRVDIPGVDPLKYQRATPAADAPRDELMTVKLRYKPPQGDESRLITVPVRNRAGELSANVGFAAAIVEAGMLLRGSEHRGTATFAEAAALARRFRGPDPEGYRAEFVRLVELAEALSRQAHRKD